VSISSPKLPKNINVFPNDKNTLHKIIKNKIKCLLKKSKITKSYRKQKQKIKNKNGFFFLLFSLFDFYNF
jgi:hypothetical protein